MVLSKIRNGLLKEIVKAAPNTTMRPTADISVAGRMPFSSSSEERDNYAFCDRGIRKLNRRKDGTWGLSHPP